ARATRTAWQTRQPIRGGRLTARSTVFRHSLFELLDPGSCLDQLLFQGQQFSDQRFEHAIFFSQSLQFFFVRHACTLVDFLSFGKSGGDLSSYDYSVSYSISTTISAWLFQDHASTEASFYKITDERHFVISS